MFPLVWSLLLFVCVVACTKVTELEYNVTWVNRNPDGRHNRPVIGINGQWPIPALQITKGEHLAITVRNHLGNETTSLHWHGLYMDGAPHMDGPPGVTQCEIPPGESFVYEFQVNQPGTYWFHSHTKGQYPDGLRAPLIVHDPEDPYQNDYEEEIVLSFSDWYHDLTRPLLRSFISVTNPTGAEPVPQSALINDSQDVTIGVQPGKTYLIRMVNIAAFAAMYVWFQGCTMRVVEVDGIYTEATETNMLYLTAGQRYSVLLTVDSRATTNIPFVASMDEELFDALPDDLISNVTGWLVLDTTQDLPPPLDLDEFEPLDDFSLRPLDGFAALEEVDKTITLDVKMDNLGDGANYAFFNNVTYVPPKVPTLYSVLSAGDQATNPLIYGSNTNSFILPTNSTIELIINNNDDGKHPFHLHGHVFQVFTRPAEDAGPYLPSPSPSPSPLGTPNSPPSAPMRRDTILIHPNSHAVLRFRATNPGVWLFHCHIEWHVTSGLTATLISSPVALQNTLSIPTAHFEVCAKTSPPTQVSGNAAGNVDDLFDLKGEPGPPARLPGGFTMKGVVALVVSVLSGVGMVVGIAWYGMMNAEEEGDGKKGGEEEQEEGESRPLLSERETVGEIGGR